MRKYISLLIGILLITFSCSQGWPAGSISGVVLDERDQPIPAAVVRVKATEKSTLTDSRGRFTLRGLKAGQPVLITAWSSGYFNGGSDVELIPGTRDYQITLIKHSDTDNSDYEWVSAFTEAGVKGSNCENCHSRPRVSSDPAEVYLPFHEWIKDAHGRSPQNERFISMYLGQDLVGNQSPATRYGYSRDYGRFPLRPDPSFAYFGPGYKIDFPDTNGNCAACHAPAAAINDAYGIDPSQVGDVGTGGVACDFCHKVWNVQLDPLSHLPFPNMPGVLSFEFRRPPEGHQFFAGPFDDVAPFEDTYSPIQRQSQFCAPCHYGVFWDTQIYNSYGEWLSSPYSDPETGRTCQDCHMPAGKLDHFARYSEGAAQRDPQTIFSHLMPGASAPSLLQNAVALDARAYISEESLFVDVTVRNDQTGHHIPTDSPLREMILLVEARDRIGVQLKLIDGVSIPEWGGVGDPKYGYYAGQPGKIYAKLLSEFWTEVAPTGAYWNPTRIVSDNRLAAFESDQSVFIFTAPLEKGGKVIVKLIFRRAFKELMDQKKWDAPDIIMEEKIINLP